MNDLELYHYGVKGMKWGVKKYRNKDGSLTPAGKKRARKYRDSELEAIDKKYATDKLDSRISKNIDRYNQNPSKALKNKIAKDATEYYLRVGMKQAESSSLRNMSLKNIDNEIREVGFRKVANVLSVVGGSAVAAVGGVGIIATTNASAYKTNRRVTIEDQNKIVKSAKYQSDMIVNNLSDVNRKKRD